MMKKLALILLLPVLAACSPDRQTEDGRVAAETNRNVDQELTGEASDDRDELRRAMRDPQRHEAMREAMREQRAARGDQSRNVDQEALRERMRERREEMAGREDIEAMRERMRERRQGRAAWWEDPAMVDRLTLDARQSEAIGQAHQRLEKTRIESRQILAESQRRLPAALKEADRESIDELLEQRAQANATLVQAEADWLRVVLAELSDEQLQTLARDNPGALISRAR